MGIGTQAVALPVCDYVLERTSTKFSEMMQCNGHYAVQGHSRSPILVPITFT